MISPPDGVGSLSTRSAATSPPACWRPRLSRPQGALCPVLGIREEEAKSFEREWALGKDGRRASRWKNLEAELERKRRSGQLARYAQALGIGEIAAAAVIRDQLAQRKDLLGRRARGLEARQGAAPSLLAVARPSERGAAGADRQSGGGQAPGGQGIRG